MKKRKMRWFGRVVSGVLTLCLMFSGFSAGQLIVSAAELTGYRDETIVRFKNVGSDKYLNVHYGQDANEVNVYQWTADGSDEQEFKLRYNEEEDCYLIGAMCSSNGNGRVLDIVKSGGQVQAGCNVEIYNATDPVAQQWQFWYRGNGQYMISPIANVYTALTAYGDANGSADGTASNAAGNVYLSEAPMGNNVTYSDYQLWEIEEVTPQATIETGVYRIASGDNKYLTLDVEDNYNVCSVGDPSNISGLDEMEKARLRSCQLWYVEYLEIGYYLIKPVTDNSRKLIAEGAYDLLEANVWAKATTNTTHNRLQWKIVPNVAGGYRIVAKAEGLSQAMTVYRGELADFTNVQMCPYQGTTCQQWTFEGANTQMCDSSSVGGHMFIKFVQTSTAAYYRCEVCGTRLDTPQEQDYDNFYMHNEELALIFALQEMAMLEQLDGDKEHLAQACYKAADIIRVQCDNNGIYDFSDKNGNYISPTVYNYNASSMDASVTFEVVTYGEMYQAEREIAWYVNSLMPFPFDIVMDVLYEYAEPMGNLTFSELVGICWSAIKSLGAEAVVKIAESPKNPSKKNIPLKETVEAVSNADLLHGIYTGGASTSVVPCIEVFITVEDAHMKEQFSGVYYVTSSNQIHIYEEEFTSTEREWSQAPENWLEGVFVADNGNEQLVYERLFT